MQIRPAYPNDAAALNSILQDLIAAEKRAKPSSPAFTLSHYIAHPDQIQCSLAIDQNGQALGFQSLKRATQGNPYGTPIGWGIIGTHIRSSAARRGVGRALFEHTKHAAQANNIREIEALIGATSPIALAFYTSLGFQTYKETADEVGKVFRFL